MKRILKTVLATGLVASSSFALAEGNFTYRQQITGVNTTNPTFGMNESEKIEYQNEIMCSTEETWTETVEKTVAVVDYYETVSEKIAGPVYNRSSNRAYKCNPSAVWTPGKYNWVYNLGGVSYNGSSTSGTTRQHNSTTIVKAVGSDRDSSTSCTFLAVEVWKKRQKPVYKNVTTEQVVVNKTDNYDYCTSNGYQTAN